jgi:(1->4)-alpha-D-glucan 1-alpha-D-glucosylmutase
MNEKHRTGDQPDRNDEYLVYQTLVGAWPIDLERLQRYMEKAVREAKTHTSWTDPNPGYEAAAAQFTAGVLAEEEFREDFESFVARLVVPGRINSLAQTLLKLTTPGVPDIYQGAELWTDSLVDPDNRRPVDFDLRLRLLDELSEDTPAQAILSRMESGLPKLWVVRQALALRRRFPDCFGKGSTYQPLRVRWSGGTSKHAVAYLRGESVAVIVPRLVMHRNEIWPETVVSIPTGPWKNELTGERVEGGDQHLSDLLNLFPVSLLSKI